jgi:hypothetical protein
LWFHSASSIPFIIPKWGTEKKIKSTQEEEEDPIPKIVYCAVRSIFPFTNKTPPPKKINEDFKKSSPVKERRLVLAAGSTQLILLRSFFLFL